MKQNAATPAPNPVMMIVIASVIAAVLTVLCAWACTNFWMPVQASSVAKNIDLVFDVITWISIFFFVLVAVLMFWFMFKFRDRNHSKSTSNITHNTTLELTWTAIPLILVIAIFYVGMKGYINLRTPPLGAYEIHVQAARWNWTFAHPNGCSESVLYIPINRPVKMVMESSDVLHALFIPAFRVKQDIVPGRITNLWFECNRAGDYELFCAEYCGKDHSQMHAQVIAVNENELQAHLQECADWAKNTPENMRYTQVPSRIYPRCSSCHSLEANKTLTGPSWRGMWDHIKVGDVVFTDGSNLSDLMAPKGSLFASPEDYVKRSILDPQQKIVERFTSAMPTMKGQLTDLEIGAIIEFFKHMDEFDDKGVAKPGSVAAKILDQLEELKKNPPAGAAVTPPATVTPKPPAK